MYNIKTNNVKLFALLLLKLKKTRESILTMIGQFPSRNVRPKIKNQSSVRLGPRLVLTVLTTRATSEFEKAVGNMTLGKPVIECLPWKNLWCPRPPVDKGCGPTAVCCTRLRLRQPTTAADGCDWCPG